MLRLGIRVERIQPGKPQQHGRLERFHRTLKAETASPAQRNLRAQQRAFDVFRADYSHQRPHEALGNKVRASLYIPSTRGYPCGCSKPSAGSFSQVLTVDKHGIIRVIVQFGSIELRRFDDQHPLRGLHPRPRSGRDNYLQL